MELDVQADEFLDGLGGDAAVEDVAQAQDLAEVLGRSTHIHEQTFRRVMETAQFLSDVLETGGLGPRGRGLRSAQKIRLLHATLRRFFRRSTDWDAPRLGLPINQEDLAGTIGSFGVLIPVGLDRLGIDLPDQDREDFFHITCVMGHLLGVAPSLMPRDFTDGKALEDRILARQTDPSQAGQILTKALVDHLRDLVGPALAGAPPSLIRHFVGDQVADQLNGPWGTPNIRPGATPTWRSITNGGRW